MKKELLKLHKEWLESGEIPDCGLCNSLPPDCLEIFLKFFRPSTEEKDLLSAEGTSIVLWGCGIANAEFMMRYFTYTPLRQSLVLLLAEMVEDPFFTDKME